MVDRYEQFIASYLRLNAYFVVPNFVVHAADNPTRVREGLIGNLTETDILAIRMPYSRERAGSLSIANHPQLVDGAEERIDVVIAEVKSGKSAAPNRIWQQTESNSAIQYILRFVGLHSEEEISNAAEVLKCSFSFESAQCRFRYVMFTRQANKAFAKRGVTYITFKDVIRFLVEVRGQCWIDAGIGVSSLHAQWDALLIDVFKIANDQALTIEDRIRTIDAYLFSAASEPDAA